MSDGQLRIAVSDISERKQADEEVAHANYQLTSVWTA